MDKRILYMIMLLLIVSCNDDKQSSKISNKTTLEDNLSKDIDTTSGCCNDSLLYTNIISEFVENYVCCYKSYLETGDTVLLRKLLKNDFYSPERYSTIRDQEVFDIAKNRNLEFSILRGGYHPFCKMSETQRRKNWYLSAKGTKKQSSVFHSLYFISSTSSNFHILSDSLSKLSADSKKVVDQIKQDKLDWGINN